MSEVRLIDANAMKAEVESLDAESNNRIYQMAMEDMLEFFIELIDKQPTIESVPVRHGRWIEIAYHPVGDRMYCDCRCSSCNFTVTIEKWQFPKFCENCGAYMGDGGADNGEV